MKDKQTFYREMLFIAFPVMIQNLIVSSLNTLDTMMISTLGSSAIAGVGLANQVFFLFICICFGINTGSSVLISQYWGRRDIENVRRVNAIAAILSLGLGILFTLLAAVFPRQIIGLMIDDPEVIRDGAIYLRMVSFSYVLTGLGASFGTSLRSTGNPRTPLAASLLSFVTNAFFNYVLIFGVLGFPRLGIMGAALGTVIARFAELALIIYVLKTYSGPLNAPIREAIDFDRPFLSKYYHVMLPVVVNETFWSIGQVLYSVAYAMAGTDATAAVQVAVAIQNIAFVAVRGLGSSCTIMIGNQIGQENYDNVHSYAREFVRLALISGIFIGATMALTPQISLMMFGDLTPKVYSNTVMLLRVMGPIFVVKSLNSIIVVGVLRGGGDTKFSMFMEMIAVWAIGVPLAFLGAAVLELPIYFIVGMAGMEEVFKAIIGAIRVYSNKWIHQLT